MDLAQEKIVFKAEKRRGWAIFPIAAAGLAVYGMTMMPNLFFNPQMSYHSQQDFSEFSAVLAGVAFFFMASKALFGEQFYVTETGIIHRYGISGKWSRINFDRIAAATVFTTRTDSEGCETKNLSIILRNYHQLKLSGGLYTDESVRSIAVILENVNIPVCQSQSIIKQARHELAAVGPATEEPAPAEQLNDPFHVYLHYVIALLPLFVAACLLVGSVVNNKWGTQTDIVMHGTVISVKTSSEGPGNSSPGKVLLRFAQKEELFPVLAETRVLWRSGQNHLRIGDRVKVHYIRGCFGLDHDLDYTILSRG